MAIDCKSYEGCTSPLCPLDKSFNKAVWYPGEPICGKRELTPEQRQVIRKQRKISRRATHRDLSFDVMALSAIKRVDTRIKGTNSDTTRKPRMNEALVLL